jgi:hypothetical protein
VNTLIRERLADADVEMAYPHRHLVFDDTSGVARVDAGSEAPRAVDPDAPAADASEVGDGPGSDAAGDGAARGGVDSEPDRGDVSGGGAG